MAYNEQEEGVVPDVVHKYGDETISDTKTFTDPPIIPDEAYDATEWQNSMEPPTKNAVRDKIETLAVDNLVMHLAGVETVTGAKTFAETITHDIGERVATGIATSALIRSILSKEDGSLDAFNEWIGTNANGGVGAQNNFTYYRGFNIDHTTGALLDQTKHGFAEGFEFWFEPETGEVYAEKHLVLTLPGGVDGVGIPHRIDSHTLPVFSPENWSLYHDITTWFLKSPIDGGQYAEFSRVSASQSQLSLLASGQIQKGVSFFITQDGTNVSLQINPLGAATEKSFSIAQWQDAALPSLISMDYPPFAPGNILTFFKKRALPHADNDCTLGEAGFRWKELHTTQIKVTQTANEAVSNFQVNTLGEIYVIVPTHADEAAAAAAGLTSGRLYKTATGEPRIKL